MRVWLKLAVLISVLAAAAAAQNPPVFKPSPEFKERLARKVQSARKRLKTDPASKANGRNRKIDQHKAKTLSGKIRPQSELLPNTDAGPALEFYRLKRAMGPRNEVPIERYETALQKMRSLPLHGARARSGSAAGHEGAWAGTPALEPWSWLGPGNIGGRVRALLIDPVTPTTMFAAGVAGGVWKTTNGGASWLPISDLMANLAVTTLAFDPDNSQVIYAGTGEGYGNFDAVRGLGLFRSIDGGANWVRLATSGIDWYYVNKVIVSSRDSNTLYAATNGGIFRSTNAGVTFTRLYAGMCSDLVQRNDLPSQDHLLAACSNLNYTQVLRSIDASVANAQWISVLAGSDFGRTSLALAPSNQSIVYALVSKRTSPQRDSLFAVMRSADGGASWISVNTWQNATKLNTVLLSNPLIAFLTQCGLDDEDFYLGQGWYDNVITVDPTNPDRVWAGGIDLMRSDDGGSNWGLASYWWGNGYNSYVHADQHAIVFHPGYNGTSNRTIFVANDGGVFRSDDALAQTASGASAACSPANSAFQFQSLNHNLGITQFYHGAVYPSGSQYLGGTQDNGTLVGTDSAGTGGWSEILGGDGGYVAVDPLNADIIYAANPFLAIKKSVNGGQTWLSASSGINDYGLFITPFQMDPVNHNRLWTGGFYMWRTDNAAGSWVQASAITPGDGWVSAIGVSPVNSNNVSAGLTDGFIAFTQSGGSTNGSDNWTYSRPRSGFVSSLTYDTVEPNTVYATYSSFNYYPGDAHVYKSTNGGFSWTPIDGSFDFKLPDVPAHSLVLNPFNHKQLYLGTDIGVFVSLDGGSTWNQENTGYVNVVTETLAVRVQGNEAKLFAFTHGRGVWRTRLRNLGLDVTPILHDFGAIGTGTVSSVRSFTVTNRSSDPVTISSISITGEFSQTNDCSTLVAGASCLIQTLFSPITTGALTGKISISYTGGDVPFELQLRGTGLTGPQIHLSESQLDLGSVEVKRESARKTVILTNTGNAGLENIATSIQAFTDFKAAHNCPVSPLPPGGSCIIKVWFAPLSAGTKPSALTVVGNRVVNNQCSPCVSGSVQLAGVATPLTVGITNIQPDGMPVGYPPPEVKVTGEGFTPQSVVEANGVARATRYESATVVYFTPTPEDHSHPQFLDIAVRDQQNRTLSLQYIVYVPFDGNEIVYDRFTQRLYGFESHNPVTIVSIDPIRGTKNTLARIPGLYPRNLTLAPDGRYLYFDAELIDQIPWAIVRFNLETGVDEKRLTTELVSDPSVQPTPFRPPAWTMVVSEKDSRDLIISKRAAGRNYGISFYKDGVLQGKSLVGLGQEIFRTLPGTSTIYNFSYFHPPRVIEAIDGKGLELVLQAGTDGLTSTYQVGKDTIYKGNGELLDAQSLAFKGRFFGTFVNYPPLQTDEIAGKTHFVAPNAISTFDNTTFDLVSVKRVGYDSSDYPISFVLLRKDLAAYPGAWRLRIFKRPETTGPGPNQPQPRLDSISPSSAPQGSHNLKVRITGNNFTRWSLAHWNGSALETDFVDANTLTAYVPHAQFQALGTAAVTVQNPADGGTSGTAQFTIETAPITMAAEFLDFGKVMVGKTRTLSWQFTNNTGAPLPLGAITLAGPFSKTQQCPTSLPPGQSCSFAITFSPTGVGREFRSLQIASSALSTPIEIPVLGEGSDFKISLARPKRPLRGATSGSLPASATLTVEGTAGAEIHLACTTGSPDTTCSITPSTIVLRKDTGTATVTVSQIRPRAFRLSSKSALAIGPVIIRATAYGETKTTTVSF